MNAAPVQPSVFLIGSTKSGTTSLYHYLMAHPAVYLPLLKEPHFFAMPEYSTQSRNTPGDCDCIEDLTHDMEAYLRLYSPCRPDQVALDCSTSYLNYSLSAERIRQFNPEAKILAILRHPVERAFSAYSHLVRENLERLNFSEALKEEPQRSALGYGGLWRYREHGHYTKNLMNFEKVFGRSKMKVMLFDDLITDPTALLEKIYDFLNLKPVMPASFLAHNISGKVRLHSPYVFLKKPHTVKTILKKVLPLKLLQSAKARVLAHLTTKLSLSEKDASELSAYYQTEIADLETWLGRDLSDWKSRYSRD
jgi:hypothetical protein